MSGHYICPSGPLLISAAGRGGPGKWVCACSAGAPEELSWDPLSHLSGSTLHKGRWVKSEGSPPHRGPGAAGLPGWAGGRWRESFWVPRGGPASVDQHLPPSLPPWGLVSPVPRPGLPLESLVGPLNRVPPDSLCLLLWPPKRGTLIGPTHLCRAGPSPQTGCPQGQGLPGSISRSLERGAVRGGAS